MRVRTGTDKFRCHSPNDEIMRGWRGFPQDRGMNRLPAALIDTLSWITAAHCGGVMLEMTSCM